MLGKRVTGSDLKLSVPSSIKHREEHDRGNGPAYRPGGNIDAHYFASLSRGFGQDRAHDVTVAKEGSGTCHDQIAFFEPAFDLDEIARDEARPRRRLLNRVVPDDLHGLRALIECDGR